MIAVLFIFLLAGAFARSSQPPSLKGAMNSPMFAMLKDVALKNFNRNTSNIHLEDFEHELSVAKIFVQDIVMSIKPIEPSHLGIDLVEGTSEFVIRGNNLSMNGSFNMRVEIAFFTVRSRGLMAAKDLAFTSGLTILKNGTRLAVNVTEVKINLVKDSIEVELSGGIAAAILNAIVSFMKGFFFDSIKGACQDFFPGLISNVTNAFLGTLPDDVSVAKGAAVKFAFVQTPKIISGYAVAPVLAYVHKEGEGPPSYRPPKIPDLIPTCKKGIQIFISDYVIRTAVETADKVGLLSYNKTTNILGLTIEASCRSNSTPVIKFDSHINFTGAVLCSVRVHLGKSFKPKVDALFTVNAQLAEIVQESTLYLRIMQMTVKDLKIVFRRIFDLKKLIKELNKYLGEVINFLNIILENKGIPLPSIAHFDISDVTEEMRGHNIFICGNLKPKPSLRFYFPANYYYRPERSVDAVVQ